MHGLDPVGDGERVAKVALAPAEQRRVGREDDRFIAGDVRARDELFADLAVAVVIELEPLGASRRRRRYVFHRRR